MTEVRLERVAHGGTVVGRLDGKVVFVTGGLPGELVRITVTETGKKFDRAKVVEVIEPASGRVIPPCPIAGRCGGCDWQHADRVTQLELKRQVVAEQLQRLAGIAWAGRVEALDPFLGWRTRMRYRISEGRPALLGRRSHDLIALPETGCLVAAPGPDMRHLAKLTGHGEVQVVVSDDGVSIVANGQVVTGPPVVHQSVAGHRFEVAADGFWQVHPRAAETLQGAVVAGLEPKAGESALDLYCGSGLFAAALQDLGAAVFGVELDRRAIAHARVNVPGARFLASSLTRALVKMPPRVDLVVLDPPRRGAGTEVVEKIASLRPRAAAYVACDPASLARDVATFGRLGYEVTLIRAFDLFPMTHHVECVAILKPTHA